MKEVPPTATQSPRDDCGIHHREVVGTDQQGVVTLLDQGAVSRPNLRHVFDVVPHQYAHDEGGWKHPEKGGQTTHFALEGMGN
jgi:hypothetical protein